MVTYGGGGVPYGGIMCCRKKRCYRLIGAPNLREKGCKCLELKNYIQVKIYSIPIQLQLNYSVINKYVHRGIPAPTYKNELEDWMQQKNERNQVEELEDFQQSYNMPTVTSKMLLDSLTMKCENREKRQKNAKEKLLEPDTDSSREKLWQGC